MPSEDRRLVLFSGLAADAGVFAPQAMAFPSLYVPPWPVPDRGDTLESYSQRLADQLRPAHPKVIGGASFGGIVALHVAQHLDVQAVLLIGSVRSPKELPVSIRLARPVRGLVPALPVRALQLLSAPLSSRVVRRAAPFFGGLARQFRNSNPAVLKWSLARLLDWSTAPQVACPVLRIHGDRDFVLPIRYSEIDDDHAIVVGGGHVLSLTHPSAVSTFIQTALDRFDARSVVE